AEFRGNLLVEFPSDDKRKDITLARSQRLEARPQSRQGCSCVAILRVTSQRILDSGQERLLLHWLSEEINSTSLHGAHAHRNVAVTREEDDRQRIVQRAESGLKVETAWTGHAHVEHDAPGDVLRLGKQEFARGSITKGLVTRCFQQAQHGSSEGVIVIDDV